MEDTAPYSRLLGVSVPLHFALLCVCPFGLPVVSGRALRPTSIARSVYVCVCLVLRS